MEKPPLRDEEMWVLWEQSAHPRAVLWGAGWASSGAPSPAGLMLMLEGGARETRLLRVPSCSSEREELSSP